MPKTIQRHVKMNVPYKVKIRANGKWDIVENLIFTKDGSKDFSYTMEDYDGLQYNIVIKDSNIEVLNFEGTVLPWKFGYNSKLANEVFLPLDYTTRKEEIIETRTRLMDIDPLPETLTNNGAFKKENNIIRNGSATYHVQSATASGYITYTPKENETKHITAYISSESGYDFGGIFVGTQLWSPTRDNIKSGYNGGNGRWIINGSGQSSQQEYSFDLEAGVTYYIIFSYGKDGSQDSGEDGIIITNTDLEIVEQEIKECYGCFYNYVDDGSPAILNCFTYNNDERVVLTPNNDFEGQRKLGTVNIPLHNLIIHDNKGSE